MVRSLFDLLGAHETERFHLDAKSKRAGRDVISNRTRNISIADRSILAAASISDRCSDRLRLLFGRRATAHRCSTKFVEQVCPFFRCTPSRVPLEFRRTAVRFPDASKQSYPRLLHGFALRTPARRSLCEVSKTTCLAFAFVLHCLVRCAEVSFDVRAFRTLHNSPLFSRYTSVRSCTLPQRFHA